MAKRKKKASKKKAGKKKASRRGGGGRESLVVTSKVKNYVRSKGYIASGDLIDAVNERVGDLVVESRLPKVGQYKASGYEGGGSRRGRSRSPAGTGSPAPARTRAAGGEYPRA